MYFIIQKFIPNSIETLTISFKLLFTLEPSYPTALLLRSSFLCQYSYRTLVLSSFDAVCFDTPFRRRLVASLLFRALLRHFPLPSPRVRDRVVDRVLSFSFHGNSFAHRPITRTYSRFWCTHVPRMQLQSPTHARASQFPGSEKRNADVVDD